MYTSYEVKNPSGFYYVYHVLIHKLDKNSLHLVTDNAFLVIFRTYVSYIFKNSANNQWI